MRCPSRAISSHHCELLVDERGVRIHDLHSESGTFVNNQQIQGECPLQDGDQFRVGKLEFLVHIESPAADEVDPVADYVSSLMVAADEQDRVRRLEDPDARHFHIDPSELTAKTAHAAEKPKELKRPPKRPPGKLPPPPKYVADNPIQAAEETLKKIFDPKK